MTLRANLQIATLSTLIALGAGAALAKGGDKAERFGKIDADGNGQVTQAEMMAHAQERFAAADTNGDGELDKDEIANRGKARHAKRADKMMKRLDKDGNGKLSATEIQGRRDPAKMFERLDADGNGTLSAEEFAKARGHGKRGKKPASE